MSKRIIVDGIKLTEKQTMLLAQVVSKNESNLRTLSDLETYMLDYECVEENIEPGKPRLKFINKKYYGPHYHILK